MPTRPLIGISASRGRGRLLTLLNRLAVWRAGGRGVVLLSEDAARSRVLDGLVVGGGDDIGVEHYDQSLTLATRTDPPRDRLELHLLEVAARRNLPVLGICRGAQMINVARGGTLHVDIYERFAHVRRVRTILPKKRVELLSGSRLRALLRADATRVNALHHQSVDRLGKGLRVTGRDGDGIVQAIEDPDLPFLLGVQWHPELLVGSRHQQRLFAGLVAVARG